MGRLNYVEEFAGTVVYYTYDKNGNLTQEITTDKTENLAVISGETERYEYYQDRTLARAISTSGKRIDYTYDTWGNLIR